MKLKSDESYFFTGKPNYEEPHVGRIDGRVEVRHMLQGLEDKRTLVILPKAMIDLRGDDWYPPGTFITARELRSILKGDLRLACNPITYINPDKLSVWGDVLRGNGYDAVLVPYPDIIGQPPSKRYGVLSKLSTAGAAVRISTRYWQISHPKHVVSAVALVTGMRPAKVRDDLTAQRNEFPSHRQYMNPWDPMPQWRETFESMIEPHRVRYTVNFDSEGVVTSTRNHE